MATLNHRTKVTGDRETGFQASCDLCGWSHWARMKTEAEAEHEAGGHEIAMSHIDEKESDYPQRMKTL